MRDYAKISTTLWQSRKFKAVDDDARLFYLYLHSCPHVNSVGCFVLPEGYASTDLRWEPERIRKAIESLSKAYLIGYDKAEETVRIVGFLDFDPFTNPKHAEGAIKIALKLPASSEKLILFKDLRGAKHADASVIDAEIERLSKGYRKPIETPNPNPNPNKKDSLSETVVSDKPKPAKKRNAYPDDFERAWQAYPTDPNMSKSEAAKAWAKLSTEDRQKADAAIPAFIAYCHKHPDYRPVHMVRFITHRRFDGFASTASSPVNWQKRLAYARSEKRWATRDWGPMPGKSGCNVPAELIESGDGSDWVEWQREAS